MTMRDFLNILFKRKWTLLLLFVLFAGGLAAAAMLWPPSYRSVASLYLQSKRETIDQSLVDNPTINRGISLLLPDVLSEVELVKCADVRRIVIEKLGLDAEPITPPKKGEPPLDRAAQRGAWDAWLYENILVEAATNANVINITFTDNQAKRAHQVVSAYADAYLEFRRSLVTDGAVRSRVDGEVKNASDQLKEAERALIAFDEKWNLVDAGAQKTELLDLLARTRSQVTDDTSALQRAQTDYKIYADLLASNAKELREIDQIRTNVTCQNLESQIATLVLQLAGLLQHNMETTDPVVRVRENIETLQKVRDRKADAILLSILFDKKTSAETIQAGLQVQQELQKKIDAELAVLLSKAMTRDRLAVDLELRQDHYKMVCRRQSQSRFGELLGGTGNIDVVVASHGFVPNRPYFPPPFFLAAIVAVITGILVSFSIVLLLDVVDQSFKTPDEIEKHLDLPVLATIPASSDHKLTPLLVHG